MTQTKKDAAEEEAAAAFGMTCPRQARITKRVRTKLGVAFQAGDVVTVYKCGMIQTGPYAGAQSYSAYSVLNGIMTAIRPTSFRFTGEIPGKYPGGAVGGVPLFNAANRAFVTRGNRAR